LESLLNFENKYSWKIEAEEQVWFFFCKRMKVVFCFYFWFC